MVRAAGAKCAREVLPAITVEIAHDHSSTKKTHSVVGLMALKPPAPSPKRIHRPTPLETARSWLPSPLKSPTATEPAPPLTAEVGGGAETARAIAQQDRHTTAVGNREVLLAIAVEIAHCHSSTRR